MQKTLEKLWDEYLSDECSVMTTEEEKTLAKEAVLLHEKAKLLLSKEAETAVEKYVDALCDLEALLAKKAFCKGCEFATRYLIEAEGYGKG